jgi:acetyltransferase (GNAT) family protein
MGHPRLHGGRSNSSISSTTSTISTISTPSTTASTTASFPWLSAPKKVLDKSLQALAMGDRIIPGFHIPLGSNSPSSSFSPSLYYINAAQHRFLSDHLHILFLFPLSIHPKPYYLLFLALEGILFLTRWLYLSILAFFSSLRTNLQICFEDLYLSSSNSGSLANTPDCRYTVVPLSSSGVSYDPPLLTSLTLSEEPESPLTTMHDLPLSLLRAYHSTAGEDRTEALHLIANGVVQQRQVVLQAVIFHPAVILSSILIFSLLARFVHRHRGYLPLMVVIWVGCLVAGLLSIQRATSGYLRLAEYVGTLAWLKEGLRMRGDGGKQTSPDDEIWITRYGDEIVGALVLRIVRTTINSHSRNSSSGNLPRALRHRNSNGSAARLTGVIRAWTVKHSYRHRGVGKGLLEAAVATCQTRKLSGPIFADDHANSTRLLPRFSNRVFQRHEACAQSLLREIIEEGTSNKS